MFRHIIIEGLNAESNSIINDAIELSLSDNCNEVTTLHVITRLVENMRIAKMFVDSTGVTPDEVFDTYGFRLQEEESIKYDGDVNLADVVISRDLNELLSRCAHIYRVTGQLVTPEILMYYIFKQTDTPAVRLLEDVDAPLDEAAKQLKIWADMSMADDFDLDEAEKATESRKFTGNPGDFMEKLSNEIMNIFDSMGITGRVETNQSGEEKIPVGLVELTNDTMKLNTEHLINREDEILDIVETMSKRNNANVLLIGEPGVGKTAIVHGLVNNIKSGNLKESLGCERVYELRPDLLIQNANMRGELESRLTRAIEFCMKKNAIIFIDEFHSIIRLGGMDGSVSATNLLKPYLEKGEIRVIGATTRNEYKKFIEGDQALCRRFKIVEVAEPSIEDTIKIINGSVKSYEEFHNCKVSKEQLKLLVNLSNRYITNRQLPDKAFAVLDEAMAVARLNNRQKVTSNDIKYVVSKISGVPVVEMSKTDIDRVSNLENTFKKYIIGQDNAIDIVCKAIKRGKAGINDPDKPVASFLFVGPTGVGKTELCKVLSQNYNSKDSKNSLIRLDMSEYSEKHSVSKLFGAPPGYVGYDEGGGLTEKVKHNPYSVILFDEIEKAHPEVFNSMLQILDEGEMTDNKGNKVNFRNCIIVMTSNAGYGAENFGKKKVGFSSGECDVNNNDNEIKALKALEETFKPEFLNRIDNVVIFNKLNKEQSKDIIKLMLKKLSDRVEQKGIKITFTDAVIDLLVNKGFDDKYNARNLKRTVQNLVENKIANEFIDGNLSKGSVVTVNAVDNEGIELKVG